MLFRSMKSVVLHRNLEVQPVWQKDYETFVQTLNFETKVCEPRYPFTKGKVERLVRFVKGDFLADRVFCDFTDLNWQALSWCNKQNGAALWTVYLNRFTKLYAGKNCVWFRRMPPDSISVRKERVPLMALLC